MNMASGELQHSLRIISKAERRLVRMTLQIANLPSEARGTKLESLGHEVIEVLAFKLKSLQSRHHRLLNEVRSIIPQIDNNLLS